MTVGPWKPITLEAYESRIVELDIRSQISEALDVKLTVMLIFSETVSSYVSCVLRKPDGSVEASANKIPVRGGHASIDFEWRAGQLQLWYPVGYGSQPLYAVEVELADQVSWRLLPWGGRDFFFQTDINATRMGRSWTGKLIRLPSVESKSFKPSLLTRKV